MELYRAPETFASQLFLSDSPDLFAAMGEHVLLSICDPQGQIVDVNEKYCRTTGFSRQELLGQEIRILNSGHHSKSFWTQVWNIVSQQKCWHGEVCNRSKNGTVYWVDATIIPQTNDAGEIERYLSLHVPITAPKQSESEEYDQQRELSDRFRRATDGSMDGMWDFEPATGRVWYSDQFKRLIGIEPSEFDSFEPVIESFIKRLHPLDKPAVLGAIEDHLDNDTSYDTKYRLLTSAGEYRWFHARARSTRDEDGNVLRMSGSLTDFHAQHAAQERLNLSTRAAKIGIWDWDIPSGNTYFNDTFFTMLGYEPGELPMHIDSWRELVHPEDALTAFRLLQMHLDGKTQRYESVHRLRKKSGDWLWVHAIGEVVERNADHSPKRVTGLHSDITAVKAAEEALAEITTAVDVANDCVFMFEADTLKFVYTNNGATLQVGFSPEELLELTPVDIKPDYDEASFRAAIEPLIASTGSSKCFRTRHQHRDGHFIPVEVSLQFVAELGSAGRFVAIVRDISEQLEAESRLCIARRTAENANQSKSDFIANVSHELRTPLTSILGFADLIDSEKELREDPKQLATAMQTIRGNAEHLLTVINDILDLSKVEAGKMVIEKIDTSLSQIIEEVVGLLKPRAEGKGIKLHAKFETAIPAQIQCDPTRIKQILLNLAGNAVKFTEVGHVSIHVACDVDQELLSISVRDTGIGMTPEQREVISRFEAFAQADTSTTRNFGGTGLGLRISNQLSEMLGGGIQVESQQGKGSSFTLTIATGDLTNADMRTPMQLATIAESSNQVGHAIPSSELDALPLSGLRILFAEDGPDNQRLISFILKKAGAEVTIVEDGKAAYEAALSELHAEHPFDVILMDMQMPVMDGYVATTSLRNVEYAGPIIALTAHATKLDRDKCIAAGCSEYHSKPIDRERLVALIAESTCATV